MATQRASKPRYAILGDLLQAGIERGDYPVGSLLPTELELCERHGVSRHTARAALAQLLHAGLVQRRPGAGTRVIARQAVMRYEHEINSVEQLWQYGNTTRLELQDASRAGADDERMLLLEIDKGKPYLQLRSLRLEMPMRQPIAVTEVLVPIRTGVPADKLADPATSARTLGQFLDPSRLSRVEQTFDATSFSAADAKLLGIKRSAPAMRVQRRYRDAGGRLLAVATSLHPPGGFAYSMVLSRNGR